MSDDGGTGFDRIRAGLGNETRVGDDLKGTVTAAAMQRIAVVSGRIGDLRRADPA